jgi:hypothetical protein
MERKRARASSLAAPDGAAAAAPPAKAVDMSARVRTVHSRVANFEFDAPAGAVGAAPPCVSFAARYRAEFGVATPARAVCHVAEYLRFMAIKAALLEAQLEQAEDEAAAVATEGADNANAAPVAAQAAPAPASAPASSVAASASAAASTPSGATPSLAVDAVWHTHLFYTRSYARFCAALLPGRADCFVHHEPSTGGAEADAHFRAQYDATTALYASACGAPPPAEAWEPPVVRFDRASQWVSMTLGQRELLAHLSESVLALGAGDSDEGDSMGCG